MGACTFGDGMNTNFCTLKLIAMILEPPLQPTLVKEARAGLYDMYWLRQVRNCEVKLCTHGDPETSAAALRRDESMHQNYLLCT